MVHLAHFDRVAYRVDHSIAVYQHHDLRAVERRLGGGDRHTQRENASAGPTAGIAHMRHHPRDVGVFGGRIARGRSHFQAAGTRVIQRKVTAPLRGNASTQADPSGALFFVAVAALHETKRLVFAALVRVKIFGFTLCRTVLSSVRSHLVGVSLIESNQIIREGRTASVAIQRIVQSAGLLQFRVQLLLSVLGAHRVAAQQLGQARCRGKHIDESARWQRRTQHHSVQATCPAKPAVRHFVSAWNTRFRSSLGATHLVASGGVRVGLIRCEAVRAVCSLVCSGGIPGLVLVLQGQEGARHHPVGHVDVHHAGAVAINDFHLHREPRSVEVRHFDSVGGCIRRTAATARNH